MPQSMGTPSSGTPIIRGGLFGRIINHAHNVVDDVVLCSIGCREAQLGFRVVFVGCSQNGTHSIEGVRSALSITQNEVRNRPLRHPGTELLRHMLRLPVDHGAKLVFDFVLGLKPRAGSGRQVIGTGLIPCSNDPIEMAHAIELVDDALARRVENTAQNLSHDEGKASGNQVCREKTTEKVCLVGNVPRKGGTVCRGIRRVQSRFTSSFFAMDVTVEPGRVANLFENPVATVASIADVVFYWAESTERSLIVFTTYALDAKVVIAQEERRAWLQLCLQAHVACLERADQKGLFRHCLRVAQPPATVSVLATDDETKFRDLFRMAPSLMERPASNVFTSPVAVLTAIPHPKAAMGKGKPVAPKQQTPSPSSSTGTSARFRLNPNARRHLCSKCGWTGHNLRTCDIEWAALLKAGVAQMTMNKMKTEGQERLYHRSQRQKRMTSKRTSMQYHQRRGTVLKDVAKAL